MTRGLALAAGRTAEGRPIFTRMRGSCEGLYKGYRGTGVLSDRHSTGVPIVAWSRQWCKPGTTKFQKGERYLGVVSGRTSDGKPIIASWCEKCLEVQEYSGSSSLNNYSSNPPIDDGPYSYNCCQEEGIATDWVVSGTVKGCSEGYWQPGPAANGYVEVAPVYGGLRAAYLGDSNGYTWEEIFCEDGGNDFSVPMTVIQTSDCDIAALMIQMSAGGVAVGPTLTRITKRRDKETGAPGLIFDPTVDTGIVIGPPPTFTPTYVAGASDYDTSTSSGYSMESEIQCYCNTDNWVFLTYTGGGLLYAPTITAFSPWLGATGQYFLTSGIRCFECYTAFGPPFDYDPSARKIAFLPDSFEICPA